MIRGIVGASLKFPLLVIAIAAAILAAGVSQIRQMPADTLPEFTPPHVEVQTEALGLSAPEVAEIMGLSVEAVKSRLHRARVAVRERVAPHVSPAPERGAP